MIPDFKISFRYSLYLFSEATLIVLLCLVSFEMRQFTNKKYNPENQSPTNHLHLSHIIKLLMPKYIWHFYEDISHNKIPVRSFVLITTQISF